MGTQHRLAGLAATSILERQHCRFVAEGRVTFTVDVMEGLDSAPDALMKLFDGGNTGKMMVRL